MPEHCTYRFALTQNGNDRVVLIFSTDLSCGLSEPVRTTELG